MKVGTRELKNRLSHYLRQVKQGEVVEVTDRGEVVAELRPAASRPGRSELEKALDELEAEGLIEKRASGKGLKPLKPVVLKGPGLSPSDMVLQDRR